MIRRGAAPSFLLAEVREVWGVAGSDGLSACGGVDRPLSGLNLEESQCLRGRTVSTSDTGGRNTRNQVSGPRRHPASPPTLLLSRP